MANPFGKSRTFHKIGHLTNTPPWKLLPTPSGLGLLTTTGRRTGKRRQRAMRVVRDGNRAYAVALLGNKSDWIRNLQSDARVRIKLGGTTYEAIGHVIVDPEERGRAAEIYRPIAGWFDYVDYLNFVWDFPTQAKVLRAHDTWFSDGTPVIFDLKGEA